MTADELRAAWYEAEVRAKYDAAALKKMSKSGETMPNAHGEPSYPIADEEDLHNAIHAIGRGHASHEAIRQHIIARAKALGLTHLLPASWLGGSDTADQQNSADENSEARADATSSGNDEGGDSGADEDDEDEDSESGSGKGTEAQGRSAAGNAEKHEDHTVANGEDELAKLGLQRRKMMAALQEKRFDPYLDSDDE